MKAKSSAHYQREFRKRLRDAGLTKKEVWILPENAKLLARIEKKLRLPQTSSIGSNKDLFDLGDAKMNQTNNDWNTARLFEALGSCDLVCNKHASIELIDGIEPSIHLTMHEYGDLPIFVTVSGEQILAEAVLWPADEVKDTVALNDTILRTHKYFPLSTISLDYVGNNKDYYHMFGALSASSDLANVIFEIEILASNVIQATEAYGDYLLGTNEALA